MYVFHQRIQVFEPDELWILAIDQAEEMRILSISQQEHLWILRISQRSMISYELVNIFKQGLL